MKLRENPVFPDPTNWGCTDALKLHHGPPCTFHASVGRPPPVSPTFSFLSDCFDMVDLEAWSQVPSASSSPAFVPAPCS